MADTATYPQSDPDQAAMQPETFVNPMVKALIDGAAANAAKPGQLMAPNPYPPGSEAAVWFEGTREHGMTDWANRTAVGMLGGGAPMAKPGSAGAAGGKLSAGFKKATEQAQDALATDHINAQNAYTNAVQAAPKPSIIQPSGIQAYHASPHDFDQFNLNNLGGGEGTSMFAKGIYAAENPHVGKYYNDLFGPDAQMYHLNINAQPHQLLDWDKALPIDQTMKLMGTHPEHVQAIIDYLNQTGKAGKDLTGADVYGALSKAKSPDYASNALLQAGVPGVKYLDAGSRMKGEGTSNFVMFDPKLIDILKKEKGFDPGAPPPASPGDAFRQQALQARNDFYHKDVQPIQSQYKENAQTLEDRRIARGYTTPAFKGGITYFDKPMEPDFLKYSKDAQDTGRNFYSTSDPQLANMYAGRHTDNGEEFYSTGGSVAPLYLNTSKYHVVDAGGANAPRFLDDAKEAAQAAGAPGVTIKNVWDEPSFSKTLPNPQDVHITFPAGLGTVKSRFAKEFNPKSTNMLKGGIGVAGAGTVADMVNALNEKKQKQ